MDTEERKDPIDLILEYEKLIQCYVEKDDPKSREELNALSAKDLKDLLAMRTVRYQFLVEDDIEKVECLN
ncbi:MAG: hypothetical protein GY866_37945 [Proteobacteria bacterium]|nr:hypothetical protein [Pseudomonadota bacterium]